MSDLAVSPANAGEVGVTKSLENHRCFNWGGIFFASFLFPGEKK